MIVTTPMGKQFEMPETTPDDVVQRVLNNLNVLDECEPRTGGDTVNIPLAPKVEGGPLGNVSLTYLGGGEELKEDEIMWIAYRRDQHSWLEEAITAHVKEVGADMDRQRGMFSATCKITARVAADKGLVDVYCEAAIHALKEELFPEAYKK